MILFVIYRLEEDMISVVSIYGFMSSNVLIIKNLKKYNYYKKLKYCKVEFNFYFKK